jgi:hypothetical protein
MERKPEELAVPASPDAIRAALLRLAVAHNRAVLAGFSLGVAVALGIGGASLALASTLGWLAAPGVGAAMAIGWKGVRLHRHTVRDVGRARTAAVGVVERLLAGGGREPLAGVEAAFPAEDLQRAMDFLGRLRLVWIDAGALVLDRERLAPLLAEG